MTWPPGLADGAAEGTEGTRDEPEYSVQIDRSHVAGDELRLQPRRRKIRPRLREYVRADVDARNLDTRACGGTEHTTGAAGEFRDGPAALFRLLDIEPYVFNAPKLTVVTLVHPGNGILAACVGHVAGTASDSAGSVRLDFDDLERDRSRA